MRAAFVLMCLKVSKLSLENNEYWSRSGRKFVFLFKLLDSSCLSFDVVVAVCNKCCPKYKSQGCLVFFPQCKYLHMFTDLLGSHNDAS